jgi:hypothetical protein
LLRDDPVSAFEFLLLDIFTCKAGCAGTNRNGP